MRPYVKLLCPLVTGCGLDRLVQWLAADDVMLSRGKVAGGVRGIDAIRFPRSFAGITAFDARICDLSYFYSP